VTPRSARGVPSEGPLHRVLSLGAVALSATIFSATLVSAREARADAPAANDVAAAEALFKEGRKLLKEGAVDAACPKFAESYRLDPGLGTLLNLAGCHEQQGRTASAWGEYRDAEQQAATAGDTKRQAFAKGKAALLEPALPYLRIVADEPPDGLVVKRDGVALSVASLDTPIPVDPGEHEISAAAPGYEEWTSSFVAVAKETVEVSIPTLDELPEAPPPPVAGSFGSAPPPDASTGRGDTQRGIGIALFGTGLVSFGVAGVFAGLTASAASDADELCPNKICTTQEGADALDDADTFATVGNVTLLVGAIASTAGIVLWLTAPSDEEGGDEEAGDDEAGDDEASVEVWIEPSTGALPTRRGASAPGSVESGLGVLVRGRF
jgi:hypothetical protein